MTLYHSPLTLGRALTMSRSPWKKVNGKRLVNGKRKTVNG